MKRCRLFGLCLAVAVAASFACGGKAPTTHYYTLRMPMPTTDRSVGAGIAVGVTAFHVDPPYDQDRIVYRIGEDSPEIGFYAYHRWAAPLSRMLPALVAEKFRGAEGVATIEPATPGRVYESHLDGRLTLLEEIDLADGQRVRLRMLLSLRDAKGAIRWSEEVEATAATKTDAVGTIVDAMGTALAEALDDARDSWERSLR